MEILLLITGIVIGFVMAFLLQKSKTSTLILQAETADKLRKESDTLWQQRFDTLTKELQSITAEQLLNKQKTLQEGNKEQISELLRPIHEQFKEFRETVAKSQKDSSASNREIQIKFDETLRLFTQQQDKAIEHLQKQTEQIGTEATNLTKALKSENKTQGDWGEMILETLLENSGLRKNEEYFVQNSFKTEEGENKRPDVLVKFPEGRCVIIDSKVSLKAYTEAMASEDKNEQEDFMKKHIKSIENQVERLSAQNYDKIVKGSIGFVLMFIPNEASYIAAMKQKPTLSQWAYKKHIIIISPSNLLMALQLAYNLWQQDRQNKNTEKIIDTATKLHDKVANFTDSFEDIGRKIELLSKSFTGAKKQLSEGNGNALKLTTTLKDLGVNSQKEIKLIEEE